jgi:membrane-associated phospholipid phosphatase
MIYASMMIKYMIDSRHKFSTVSIGGILFCGPLAFASWVGITRIQDHFHNTDDVMMGGFIGLVVGYYFFKNTITLFETHTYNNRKNS